MTCEQIKEVWPLLLMFVLFSPALSLKRFLRCSPYRDGNGYSGRRLGRVGKVKVAGLDIGFSTTRRSAGVGVYDGEQIKLIDCFGVEACKSLIRFGTYDIVAIDGPIVPKDFDITEVRLVERLFCRGLFQKRCKPGMSHIPNTGVRLREEAGKAADLLFDALHDPQNVSSFPRVRKGPIIEAFPNAFLGVCLDDDVFAAMPSLQRGKKFDWLYEQWRSKHLVAKLLRLTEEERVLFQTEFDKTGHHEHRAALICVLTGLLTAHGHFTAIGDVQGGWFFLPPWSCWKEWARDAINSGIRELNREGEQIELRCVGD
jgi:hypothetical protein